MQALGKILEDLYHCTTIISSSILMMECESTSIPAPSYRAREFSQAWLRLAQIDSCIVATPVGTSQSGADQPETGPLKSIACGSVRSLAPFDLRRNVLFVVEGLSTSYAIQHIAASVRRCISSASGYLPWWISATPTSFILLSINSSSLPRHPSLSDNSYHPLTL